MSNAVIFALIDLVIAGTAIVLGSFLVEATRPISQTPELLPWVPDIPIQYVTVNGARLRYIEAGQGPTLILLHTLRTQLDLFESHCHGQAQILCRRAPENEASSSADRPCSDCATRRTTIDEAPTAAG